MTKKKVKEVFKLKCPLGYTITLDKACWKGHILKFHTDLILRQLNIEETLINPDEVREDDKENRYNLTYWKLFPKIDPINPYLKVAVMIDKHSKTGIITSAYPVLTIYGGKKIWPK